ncbi:MAG: pentapeptide repeat-containing protein [Planctomycetes bacterium]|nr:pentapeptide repeat-containing protein [Planctomycetota bacterium]
MADTQHLEKLLTLDAHRWNMWRFRNDIRDLDLTNANLDGKDLSYRDLDNADFTGSSLRGALAVDASFKRADLTDADLSDVDFWMADLREAVLELESYTNLCSSDAHDYRALQARKRGPRLSNRTLRLARLEKAFLERSYLSDADLRNANLRGAVLDQAVLWGADLRGADLREASLIGAKLWNADLADATLEGANLRFAELDNANLSSTALGGACFEHANLQFADLRGADLRTARLGKANLSKARLEHANLQEADLRCSILVEADLTGATLRGASVYGISAWGITGTPADQTDLKLADDPALTVDNLEVAQLIHLLQHNAKIRDVIDVVATKVVLILGNFSPPHRLVLDGIRDSMGRRGYVPVLFDWSKPESQDLDETVLTLAQLSRFVIVDLTEASSVAHELQLIMPNVWKPVVPILRDDRKPYTMFDGFQKYPYLLAIQPYRDLDDLLQHIDARIIRPAEEMVEEIRHAKRG